MTLFQSNWVHRYNPQKAAFKRWWPKQDTEYLHQYAFVWERKSGRPRCHGVHMVHDNEIWFYEVP